MGNSGEEPGDWFRLMCEHSPDFMVVIDRERRFRWVNRLHPGTKLEDVIGKPLETFEHPDTHAVSRAKTDQAFETGEPQSFESHSTMPDGSEAWFHVRCIPIAGHPDRLLLVTSDVSDRKRAERDRSALQRELHQSRKMEALGRLAAGVSHDFNNLLTPILGYTQMAMSQLEPDHRAREALRGVFEAALRAAELSGQLLTVGRGRPPSATPFDLCDLVREMERILRRVVPENVALCCDAVKRGANVRADQGQLEQVLLNLVINACDAMPLGGTLTIGAARRGERVVLSVSDTGDGIDSETMIRLFEPFFSTKGARGNGLGLATSHGIVVENGGSITVTSEVGTGSTFEVSLPFCEAPIQARPSLRVDAPGPARREGVRVLVVEDEEVVRKMVSSLLEDAGYQVVEASSGSEAIERARAAGRIDLVLTDVVMPRMSGPRVVEQLRPLYPELCVLYMSGHAMDLLRREDLSDAQLLRKPFTRIELLDAVDSCLRSSLDPRADREIEEVPGGLC